MRELSIEEKKELGKLSNEARTYVTDIISKKETEIKEIELAEKLANDTIDISLPSEKIKKEVVTHLIVLLKMLKISLYLWVMM